MSKTTNPDAGPVTVTAKTRQRRKDARPTEIISAALEVFSEYGFDAAKIEEVARRAGVSKGTVFVYFENKEELFRAVARSILASHLSALPDAARTPDLPFAEFVTALLKTVAAVGRSRALAMLRLLIAEAPRFTDLAQVWYDEVASKVLTLLTGAIERAQERGEVRAGDPLLFAMSIIGPMLAATLFREVLGTTSARLPDAHELAVHHANLVVRGMMAENIQY